MGFVWILFFLFLSVFQPTAPKVKDKPLCSIFRLSLYAQIPELVRLDVFKTVWGIFSCGTVSLEPVSLAQIQTQA